MEKFFFSRSKDRSRTHDQKYRLKDIVGWLLSTNMYNVYTYHVLIDLSLIRNDSQLLERKNIVFICYILLAYKFLLQNYYWALKVGYLRHILSSTVQQILLSDKNVKDSFWKLSTCNERKESGETFKLLSEALWKINYQISRYLD